MGALFFGYGSMTYLSLFYDQIMLFSPLQIGILTSLPPIISFLIAPQFMFIADKYNWHRNMMVFCSVASAVATMMFLLLRPTPDMGGAEDFLSASFLLTVAVTLSYAIPWCAIAPLIDMSVLTKLKQRCGDMDEKEQKKLYGKQRWVGSITYGLSAFIMGYLYGIFPRMSAIFVSWTVSVGVLFVGGLYMPQNSTHTPNAKLVLIQSSDQNSDKDIEKSATMESEITDDDVQSQDSSASSQGKASFIQSVRILSGNSDLVLFWAFAFVQGLCQSVVNNFLNIMLVERLNAGATILAVGSLNRVLLEAPFFFFNGPVQILILKCLGLQNVKPAEASKWVMICSQIILGFRTLMYALLSFFTLNPYIDLGIELLHGAMYANFYGNAVQAAAALAPKEYQGTSQGIFSSIYCGLGPFVGSILGGYIYNSIGSGWMFLICSILCVISSSTYAYKIVRGRT
ncbi:hypothetical protein MP228_004596 [Amoeboaphelidium protococcarum]|nr:hypothetical protein MP228_004596 [Amoeboaphelidium protococcarum]